MKISVSLLVLLLAASSCKTVNSNRRRMVLDPAAAPNSAPTDKGARPTSSSEADVQIASAVLSLPAQIATNKPAMVTAQAQNVSDFKWQQKSGPGKITFASDGAASAEIQADIDGLYSIILEATDKTGRTVTAEMAMLWDTQGPTINLTKDMKAFMPMAVEAEVSTDAVKYVWAKVSGKGNVSLDSSNAARIMFAADADDTYVLRLSAYDALGNMTSSDITILWNTTEPMVALGTDLATRQEVTLTPMDKGVVSYSWSKVAGPGTVTFGSPTGKSTTVKADKDGDYRILLTAMTSAGRTTSDEITITWDTTPPLIESISMVPVAFYYGGYLLQAVIKDYAKLRWSYTSASNGRMVIDFPEYYEPLARAMDGGPFQVQVEARDRVGNVSTFKRELTLLPQPSVATAIASSGTHACVVLRSGGLRCWGLNDNGRLGNGNTEPRLIPSDPLLQFPGTVVDIKALGTGSAVVLDDGSIFFWGEDPSNNDVNILRPKRIKTKADFGGKLAKSIGIGHWQVCAVLDSGEVSCWGQELVDGKAVGFTRLLGFDGGRARALSFGSFHGCALLEDGGVNCWGDNSAGQQGLGDEVPRPQSPAARVLLDGKAVSITANHLGTCAVLESGRVQCWGYSVDSISSPRPLTIRSLDGFKTQKLVIGSLFVCGLNAEGAVRCVGNGFEEKPRDEFVPTIASNIDLGRKAKDLVGGESSVCALLEDGTVRCWGINFVKTLLGYDAYTRSQLPHPPVPL